MADRPAYDLIVQAMSGLMHIAGQRDGPPTALKSGDRCLHRHVYGQGISTALFNRNEPVRAISILPYWIIYSMMRRFSGMLYTETPPEGRQPASGDLSG